MEKKSSDQVEKVKKRWKGANLSTKRLNSRMVKRYARVNNAPACKTDDKVLVRYRPRRRGSIPPKGHIIIEGTIVKKSKNNPAYMVRIMLPNGSEIEIDE